MTQKPCWQWVKFVPQDQLPLNTRYESHIFFYNEIPTREACWHDFFNYLTWIEWPKSKRALNQRMMREYLRKPEHHFIHRNFVQNRLALLEECGLVICAKNHLLDKILHHEWSSLFLEQRESFDEDIKIYVFGHGLYEKCLNPYLGLTGFAWLIPELLTKEEADDKLAATLLEPTSFQVKTSLNPFPLLGVPGAVASQDHAFYQNQAYFRPKASDKS